MGSKEATAATQKQIEELRQKHGAVVHFMDPKASTLFVFRAPELEEWEDYQQHLAKQERVGVANRELCGRTLVLPAGEAGVTALDAVFARAPRVPTMVVDELGELANGGIEITVKKD